MKQWVIALGAMWVGAAAYGQTTPAPAPPTISLSAPVASSSTAVARPGPGAPIPTTKPDNARYVADPNLLAACQADLDAFKDKPCNVIFIGGTAASGWRGAGHAIWQKYYEPRQALNFSVAGDTIQNVLWRLNNMELSNLHPKVAVILIGASNTGNTAHEIADGIKAVIANTQAVFSNVKILLVSIVPNGRDHDKMLPVNSIIRNYADDSSIFFINLVPRMPLTAITNADGTTGMGYMGIGADGVMPNATGYQIWADAMEPVMTKLVPDH